MQSVSVVIPTKNEERNIPQLLPRVLRYGYEVVVVDDSDDATAEIAESLGARVVKGRGLGLAQAVLDGIDASDSDHIIVMDADCLPLGTKIFVPGVKQVGERLHRDRQKYRSPYSISYIRIENIESLKVGDSVLSYNEKTGKKEWDEVTGLFCRYTNRLIKLKFSNGNELSLTKNHPIFVHGKGWVRADEIQVDDQVIQCKSSSLFLRLWNLSKRGKSYEEIHGLEKASKYKAKVSDASKRNNYIHREKISQGHKRAWNDKHSGYYTSEKFKEHRKQSTLLLNEFNRRQKGKTYKERYGQVVGGRLRDLRARQIGLSLSPNKAECELDEILNRICPDEFKYNGVCDLGIVINHHVPDFWNVNGKKKVIELFGEPWHPKSDEVKYLSDYKQCGVECLIIWCKELRNTEKLEQKILDFIYNPNTVVVTVIAKEVICSRRILDTYNLETKKNHNFFAYGILVHNCQHPPELLPDIVNQLGFHDLVVVTKHTKEAMDELSRWRRLQSNLAVMTARVMVSVPVSDPMTGFFGIRRKCLEGIPRGEYYRVDYDKANELEVDKPEDWETWDALAQGKWYEQHGVATKMIGLEAIGFKIGLELFAKAKWVSHSEIPMSFANRQEGQSKGTAHSLHRHLWRIFKNSLDYVVELPKGSEEYYAFYEGTDWQKKWKQSIAWKLQGIVPKRILDVGCGSSPNINYLEGDRIGIDINKRALEYMAEHSDAKFMYGNILDIPFPDESFDTVVCIEVLEHLYPSEISKAVSELARVIKPNSYAVIATPNYASRKWNIVESMQKWLQPKSWTSDHHTHFKRDTLKQICLKYGLTEVCYDSVMHNMDMVVTYQKK